MEVATGTTHITTPEHETENPIRIQPGKALSFTNGVLKRHHHPPPPVTYKECLKNHAASMGGHAVDGCGEFMPSPAPLKCAAPDAAQLKCAAPDPGSLKCAACGCHRNFHRREPDEPPPAVVQHVIEYQPHHRHHPPPPPPPHSSSSPDSLSPPPISSSYYPSAPHMLLALSAGVSTPPADPNPSIPAGAGITSPTIGNPNGRKRFRTKFTQNQKEKMQEFAERIKWKIQRSDEVLITEFCSEIGVDRGVLKVWMHNNKGNLGKKDANNNGPEIDHINLSQNLHNTTNGSCSSS